MPSRKRISLFATVLFAATLAGCGGTGSVNQGQVVEFDGAKGLVVLIQDSNYLNPASPKFDVLPPVRVRAPVDQREMGPAPEAGKLLALDCEKKQLVVFDAAAQGFRTIDFTLIGRWDNVYGDDSRVAGVRFPVLDPDKRTITVYRSKQRRLVTFSVPGEIFGWPADCWRTGDEVRYYYKDPGQALRMMNITKTDLHKAGK
jgi:hypothetical protein